MGLWTTYDFTKKVGLALRTEFLSDANGVDASGGALGFMNPPGTGQDLTSAALTLNYRPWPNLRSSRKSGLITPPGAAVLSTGSRTVSSLAPVFPICSEQFEPSTKRSIEIKDHMKKYCVIALACAACFAAPFVRAAETIKVGILHSLSGTMAISETSLRDVLLFAFDEINKAGGIKVGGKTT